MKRRSALRQRAEYAAFRLVTCLVQMLTVRQSIRVADLFAWLMTRVLPRKLTRYDVARDNIARSFPEFSPAQIDATIAGMWRHLARMVAEIIQLPRKMTLENCREVIVFRNRQVCVRALCSGRPVFLLGGHFGNWEMSMATFGLFGFPVGVVARRLDNPYLHEWFFGARQQTGHKLIDKSGAADEMLPLLAAGGNLGLLCDQDAGPRGLFVDFFGRPASTFKSIALMALEYDALIVVGYGLRLPDAGDAARWVRYEIGCEEVIDVRSIDAADPIRAITQRYTSALERAIRRAPEQYFWVHRRWKTDPVTRRKPGKERGAGRRIED